MFSPLTRLLLKIFATGFYRAHSGMLVFLFGTIISYCFFINTLGSVPIWAFAEWNLIITLSVVSDPFALFLFFLVCLGYAFKSMQFIAGQLSLKSNEFLYYSSASLNKLQQFKSWFIVQFNVLLPLWVYGFFATAIGINYGHYIFPAGMLIYLFILTGTNTLFYLNLVNKTIDLNRQTAFIKIVKNFRKPFFLLYSYHVFNKLKLTYFVTKIFSWVFIVGMVSLFPDQKEDGMIPATIVLVLVTTHSFIIYNDYRFSETFLYFSHNFPYAKINLFLRSSVNYLVLMLPELLWFIRSYHWVDVSGFTGLTVSVLLLYRSLLYWFGLNIKKFLFCVFLLFNVFFLVILYHAIWYLPLINLGVAYLVFTFNYSNQSLKD